MKESDLIILSKRIYSAELPASLNYIKALKIRLDIERLKYSLGYTETALYKNNITDTIKKIFKEIIEFKATDKSNSIKVDTPDTIVEVELVCIIHQLQIETIIHN